MLLSYRTNVLVTILVTISLSELKNPRIYGGSEAASRGIEPLLKTPERPILLGF
jgi:hypothetical protein